MCALVWWLLTWTDAGGWDNGDGGGGGHVGH